MSTDTELDIDRETEEEEVRFVALIQKMTPDNALHALRVAIVNAAIYGAGDFMLWQQDPDHRTDVELHPDAMAYVSEHARLGHCIDVEEEKTR